ncbi:TlpA family protein disulfide reductase [Novosphingobium sp. G106]|uniref:TlpA family protein disulfide reductase n=1 Tax=Novosphingobium sp. G106 TaxID=2849500 RepID=UPI0020C3F342|nr:TlpA family protein disulfide reductase [Novosphingobium sp. G106]
MLSFRSLNLAVLGLAVAVAGCNRESGEKAQPQASTAAIPTDTVEPKGLNGAIDYTHKGSPLPAFSLTDAAGKTTKLAAFKGKPLLVNLWATWCAPCVLELPMLDKLAETRGGEIKVLTVSQDMTGTEKVAPFLEGKGLKHLEPWLDQRNDLAFQYGASTLPTTVYYDASGKEVWRYVGGHDWTSADTAKMLAEGLGKK